MAKGQAQAANKNLATTNQIGANELTESNQLEGQLLPGYTSLMNTGYLNPQQKEAATTSEMGAATAPFAAADTQATNRAAATRNPSDLTAQQDQLAIEKGQAAGGAADTLQSQQMQNQEAGMYGINQLQAGNQAAATSMYGLGPSTLQARAAGGPNPILGLAQSALGAAGAAAG
jgi:hypothetical protein